MFWSRERYFNGIKPWLVRDCQQSNFSFGMTEIRWLIGEGKKKNEPHKKFELVRLLFARAVVKIQILFAKTEHLFTQFSR